MQDRHAFMPPLPPGRVRILPDKERSKNRLEMPKLISPALNGSHSSPSPLHCSSLSASPKSLQRGGVLRTAAEKQFFSFASLESSVSNCGSLAIEGNKTGEEVLVEQTAPRQRKDFSSDDLSAIRRQLAQAKGEVRELASKLRKTKKDSEQKKEQVLYLLSEMTDRRDKELSFLHHREDMIREEVDSIRLSCENTKALNVLRDHLQMAQKELTEQGAAFDQERSKWMQKKKEESEKISKDDLLKAKSRMKELEELLDSERSRFSFDKQKLIGEKSGVELLLQQSYEKLHNLEVLRAEEDFIVSQCRQFVKNVCQPGFTVVKDISLEPVEKNREYPTGYVLVPLIILLHGYTLLPMEDREKVIQEYEDRATWLKPQ